jgi:membrane fusion protein, multidrug efflux system
MKNVDNNSNGHARHQSSSNLTSLERTKTTALVLDHELDSDIELVDSTGHPLVVEHEPIPTNPLPRKRINVMPIVLAIGAIALGGYGYHWWQYASTHEETDNAIIAGNVHPVSTRIDGTVSKILVDDNQKVPAGQLIVQLDPRDYQVKLQQSETALEASRRQAASALTKINLAARTAKASTTQAQGSVNSANSEILSAQAAVEEAQAGIPSAQAQVVQAEANLVKAQADDQRYSTLYNTGAVSRQQYESSRATYLVAVAQKNSALEGVRQAQAKLVQAQKGIPKAEAQLTNAQGSIQQAKANDVQTKVNRSDYNSAVAAIQQAQANLKEARLQLSYVNITAPTSGRIGNKKVQVGQRVQTGTPLLSIVDNNYWVVANFKETQLKKMYPGQTVELKVDAFPDHPFVGRVDSFSPASGAEFALLPPDNATGNFTKVVQRIPVKIVFDAHSIQGYESRITPGMSVVATVNLQH